MVNYHKMALAFSNVTLLGFKRILVRSDNNIVELDRTCDEQLDGC